MTFYASGRIATGDDKVASEVAVTADSITVARAARPRIARGFLRRTVSGAFSSQVTAGIAVTYNVTVCLIAFCLCLDVASGYHQPVVDLFVICNELRPRFPPTGGLSSVDG